MLILLLLLLLKALLLLLLSSLPAVSNVSLGSVVNSLLWSVPIGIGGIASDETYKAEEFSL